MAIVSPVNYRVKQPVRRKPKQLYHINLMKEYHERNADVMFCSQQEQPPPEENLRALVD
jgi:hypothetical protein